MDGVATMSDLPDHILRLILSRLPSTEEVHRTSILSKRWRYLWTSIPSIDTDYTRQKHRKSYSDKYKFEEFVYWVLATKSSDLDNFRLCYPEYHRMLRVKQWIRIAVMRKVKVVDLMIYPRVHSEDLEVPYCLVSCGSLEVLRLGLFDHRLGLPLFNGFQALRVLELTRVKLTDGGLVQHFFEQSCPSLEELSFIHCTLCELGYLKISCANLKKLRIDNRNTETDSDTDTDRDGFLYSGVWISCPKLVFLELGGHVADSFSLKNLDSLKKAVIHPEDLDDYEISYNPTGESISSLFAQISHVEFMSLSHYFFRELDVPVSLPNLMTLELTTTLDAYNMDIIIKFVLCFPHLESLHLIIQEVSFTEAHWNLYKGKVMRVLGPCLKRVEFLQFRGERVKLIMVRSLLKYGKVLEKMFFNWHMFHRYKSVKIMKNVSKFSKASSTVKIVTLI